MHIAIAEELFFGLCELFSVYFGCILVFLVEIELFLISFIESFVIHIAWLSVCLMVSLDYMKT